MLVLCVRWQYAQIVSPAWELFVLDLIVFVELVCNNYYYACLVMKLTIYVYSKHSFSIPM